MNDKAIRAAAKEIERHKMEPWTDTKAVEIARDAIAAYEAAMWRPIEECPEEWKDGRGLLAMSRDWPDQIAVTWNAQRRSWCLLGLSSIDLGDWGEPDFLRPLSAAPESEDTPND